MVFSAISLGKESVFFFEKKNQKTFVFRCWGGAGRGAIVGGGSLARVLRAAVVLLAVAVPARGACIMNRVALLPVTLWQNKLYVPVTVNGTARRFFVDTGAAVSAVSEATAAELNIPHDFDHTMDMFGVGGQESRLYIGEVDRFSVGGVEFRNRRFPVSAFGDVLADGLHHADGLIGADILSRFDVDIDIPRRQIGLWTVQDCSEVKPDWPGGADGVQLAIEPSRHVTVPVRIDGAPLELLLDTGAPALVLSTRAAAEAGATPDILEQNPRITGFGMNNRSYPAWLHIFRRLEVGRQVYGDIRAVVVNRGRYADIGDGLLGIEFLKRGRVWISYATSMFFTESAGG
jgi:predicted aspartyl protease